MPNGGYLKKEEVIALQQWFTENKRNFPWRESPSPYAVWISEVMLQQTRAEVVIPYFTYWMKIFPTVESLANASQEQVLKAWEGLGYYSRARNIHRSAQWIMEHYGGKIPDKKEELQRLPGFGLYTTNAVLNFAFNQALAPVDGNVMRVMTRYFHIDRSIARSQTQREILALATKALQFGDHRVIAESLIELGALICKKKPHCIVCPLKQGCMAKQSGRQQDFPVKPAKQGLIRLTRMVAVLIYRDQILLQKGGSGDIMQDLYFFPYFEGKIIDAKTFARHLAKKFHGKIRYLCRLPQRSHTFTKYKALLIPYAFAVEDMEPNGKASFMPIIEAIKRPFCSGHREIFADLRFNEKIDILPSFDVDA